MNQQDFQNMVNGISNGYARMVQLGVETTEDRFRPAIRCLEREFFAAQMDPDTTMKTSLQVAICAVLALLPSPITDKVSDYANRKIKDDQLSRHEGRADHDFTTRGTKAA
jgi:hypothetical protein